MKSNSLRIALPSALVLAALLAASPMTAQERTTPERADATDPPSTDMGFPRPVVALPMGPFPASYGWESAWPLPVLTASVASLRSPIVAEGWTTPPPRCEAFKMFAGDDGFQGSSLLNDCWRMQIAGEPAPLPPLPPRDENAAEVSSPEEVRVEEVRPLEVRATAPIQPEPPAAPLRAAPAPAPAVAAVLILRDGSRIETFNYAIVGATLWTFEAGKSRKFSGADLDLEATSTANRSRGIRLILQDAK
jgi:hypothetical protein